MIFDTLIGLVPMLVSMVAAPSTAINQGVTRLVIQDTVIWRVPVRPQPVMRQIEWVESKGPDCISARSIRGALIDNTEQVDFVLVNSRRIRADFGSDCGALDFYQGFYIKPGDGFLCARRDAIHSRMGVSCTIGKFRFLQPRIKR